MLGKAHRDMIVADHGIVNGHAQAGELGELRCGCRQIGIIAAVEQEAAD